MIPNLHRYLDIHNLPVTLAGDGGDSCAEAGTIMALNGVPYDINLSRYFPDRGPVRHPDITKWYGRPGRFSRDQMIPLLCAFAVRKQYFFEAEDLYLMHRKNCFLAAWNTIRNFQYETIGEQLEKAPQVKWNAWPKAPDFTGPEVWALWFRIYPRWWKWPLLCVLDIETLLSAVHWNWRDSTVSRNHLLSLHVGKRVMPTPTMWLARMITPIKKLIEKWDEHCESTGAVNTAGLFRKVFKV